MRAAWLAAGDCDLAAFRAEVERVTDLAEYPYAAAVEHNVLIYDAPRLRGAGQRVAQAELVRALTDGPGIAVFRNAFADRAIVDRASEQFSAMIAEQRARGLVASDHFAKPGANDRVWNALQKLALRAPGVFADYYANEVIALVSAAWLGPGYQVTSQINVVNPGGAAQVAHRDYHLGFQPSHAIERYPAHVHRLAAVLTLQGAVAHCDMPVESGPTLYLPYSQRYLPGYLATSRPEFREYFDEHRVQLPLATGDAAFFNPALFHAAGANRSTDIRRMANLLQVSSAFGRAMESVDREAMCNAMFPELLRRRAAGVPEADLRNVVAACAEGYAFPTDLDRDQPVGGLAPPTQADLLWTAVRAEWPPEKLRHELRAHAARREA